jgi:antibiotic biosynthesis monooxygenase (ABM) superfamily enzyme
MNRMCIITTKIPKITSVNFYNLIDYQNELTTVVNSFPGYLDSVSYWKQTNEMTRINDQHIPPQTTTDRSYNTICNISNWESLEGWNNWVISDTRNNLKKKYSENVENEHHAFLYQRYNFNDTSLL